MNSVDIACTVADDRCEVDGRQVPLSDQTQGRLNDDVALCSALLVYRPWMRSRVRVLQEYVHNAFLEGKVSRVAVSAQMSTAVPGSVWAHARVGWDSN
jgi:hypothetical protein